MFERFTPAAVAVVRRAEDYARALKHGMITPDHLLLGLLDEDGITALALRTSGVTHVTVLADLPGSGTGEVTGHIPFTPRTKRALEFSLREALQLGHNEIRPEHLLLGVIREANTSGECTIAGQRGAGVFHRAISDFAVASVAREALRRIEQKLA